jgi:hypothetical protein
MVTSSRLHAFCTAVLVVLIVTPFTAPFSTCAIGDLFAVDADRAAAMLVPPSSPEAGAASDAKASLHAARPVSVPPLAVVGLGRRLTPPPRAGSLQLLFTVIRV